MGSSRGCLPPPPPGPLSCGAVPCPGRGIRSTPTTKSCLASICTLPAMESSFLRLPNSTVCRKQALPTRRGESPVSPAPRRAEKKGPGPGQVSFPTSPRPPPHDSPPAPQDPGELPGRAAVECAERRSQFCPAHRHTTAPARRARRPNPSKAHYLTVPTRVPRRPLRGLAPDRAPGTDRPASGSRPRSRGCLLPAGYSTWVRVTGRHEAGSEHCPSAAILPGDRASPSSQWGARGAVVLTYHAGEAPLTQSETDTGSGAAIQSAGRGAGPYGESEGRAPRSLLAVPASAQSGASAGKCLTNQRRGGFRRTTGGRTANQKVRPARRVGRAGQSASSLGGVLNFWWELWFWGTFAE